MCIHICTIKISMTSFVKKDPTIHADYQVGSRIDQVSCARKPYFWFLFAKEHFCCGVLFFAGLF